MAILIGFKDFIQFYFVLFALIFITLRFGIPACAARVGCDACGRVTIVCLSGWYRHSLTILI
jgi:hypothetical protein